LKNSTSCGLSGIMRSVKETVHTWCCHWLTITAAFIMKIAV